AGLRVAADFPRQRQQRQRPVEVDIGRRQAARQRNALRLLLCRLAAAVVGRFAELNVCAVRPLADGDRQARCRIGAQLARAGQLRFGLSVLAVLEREPAGVAALRVVRAADEGAELAELEAQPPGLAGRAGARVGAV